MELIKGKGTIRIKEFCLRICVLKQIEHAAFHKQHLSNDIQVKLVTFQSIHLFHSAERKKKKHFAKVSCLYTYLVLSARLLMLAVGLYFGEWFSPGGDFAPRAYLALYEGILGYQSGEWSGPLNGN